MLGHKIPWLRSLYSPYWHNHFVRGKVYKYGQVLARRGQARSWVKVILAGKTQGAWIDTARSTQGADKHTISFMFPSSTHTHYKTCAFTTKSQMCAAQVQAGGLGTGSHLQAKYAESNTTENWHMGGSNACVSEHVGANTRASRYGRG